MNKLGKRLEVIASLVNCKRIADVGCDHGKLAYYLLDNGIVDYAVVSDISKPSLNKAVDILSKTKYNFDYICCDGLTGYKGYNIDQCIIAGMGGDEIIKIIFGFGRYVGFVRLYGRAWLSRQSKGLRKPKFLGYFNY